MENIFITINSIEPYTHELNSYLSLPKNSIARVRFKKNWLPEISEYSDMEGKEGFILLRNYYKSKVIIPLRKIMINKVKVVGDIVYIEFFLLEIPCYPGDVKKFGELIERLYSSLSSSFDVKKYENIDGEDLSNLVFYGGSLHGIDFFKKGAVYDEIANWGVLVGHFDDFFNEDEVKIFSDFDFIKFVELKSFDGRVVDFKVSGKEGASKYYFELKPETEYKATFLQRTYTGRKGNSAINGVRKVKLTPESNMIKSLRNGYIYGKYDLINSSFTTVNYLKKSYSEVEISISSNVSDHVEYPFVLPFKLTTSLSVFIFNLFSGFIFFGGLVLYYNPELLIAVSFNLSPVTIKEVLLPMLILSGANIMKDIKDIALGRLTLI
ncbi:hypothetical protein [Shewanella oncorhynchi]|uniref:hypothetical protein n=1 Tax=Shewanella oncorhynchi TaxID=2726434 RepID=UPI003D7AA4F7